MGLIAARRALRRGPLNTFNAFRFGGWKGDYLLPVLPRYVVRLWAAAYHYPPDVPRHCAPVLALRPCARALRQQGFRLEIEPVFAAIVPLVPDPNGCATGAGSTPAFSDLTDSGFSVPLLVWLPKKTTCSIRSLARLKRS